MTYKKNTNKKSYAEEVAAEIVASLEKGVETWRKSWAAVIANTPANGHTKRGYRGCNAWHLAARMDANGWQDPRFYTFKQVQQLGGKVKKGSHGTSVEFWLWNSGKIVLGTDSDGNEITQKIKPFSVIYSTVFNAEQCEGLPALDTVKPVQTWTPCEHAERIMKASGVTINHNQGDRAFYSPGSDYIDLPPRGAFKTAEAYYATALHELVHATGHPSRCNRPQCGAFGSPSYAAEELRAEIGSLMLCAKLGINPPDQDAQHKAYLASWLKALKNDPKEIFKAASDAERALDWLLSKEAELNKLEKPLKKVAAVVAEPVAAYGVPSQGAQQSLF